MKISIRWIAMAVIATVISLQPNAGWSSQMFSVAVTGEVTATPVSSTIEVEHKSYHVKPHSLADKNLRQIKYGQIVDLVLDGPPDSGKSQVVAINPHAQP
jgi:hypothetical protein